jgi:hypothetical protein
MQFSFLIKMKEKGKVGFTLPYSLLSPLLISAGAVVSLLRSGRMKVVSSWAILIDGTASGQTKQSIAKFSYPECTSGRSVKA